MPASHSLRLMTADAVFEHDDELARIDHLLTDALYFAGARPRDTASPHSAMSAALAEACRLAHRRRLQPEQIIIMLKSAWARVNDTSFATRHEAQEALAHAVTACIEQYFAERATAVGNPILPQSQS